MNELGKIPLYSNCSECDYFSNQESELLFTTAEWYNENNHCEVNEKIWFTTLLEKGFRRNGKFLYINSCKDCHECTPIRIPVEQFAPSKSQRVVWRKNQDVEVKLVTEFSKFVTDEKVLMLREYDFYHNGKRKSVAEMKEQLELMNSGYPGILNLEFYLNGKLIGVSLLDYSENEAGKIVALSSNYFYYDTSAEILKRSIGVFSVLKELEFCKEHNIQYYYLGLYLPDCRKMNYKTNYKPYELLIHNKWFSMPESIDTVVNTDFKIKFPYPGEIYSDPNICCVTDEISVQLLYSAYRQGIFPWFNEDEGEPVVWHCPEKRFVLKKEDFHISKSIKKFLKKNHFTYTVDKCFSEVIKNCAAQNRPGQLGTWIGSKIMKSYTDFYKAGFAHSIEVWNGKELAGGFYGILMGKVFCGESMFTKESESSKSAFVLFAQSFFAAGGIMIDCQAETENMARYGAKEIEREEYLSMLKKGVDDNMNDFNEAFLSGNIFKKI